MLITSCAAACNVSLQRFVRRNIQNQLHVSMTEDVRPGKRFEFNRNLFIVARSKIGVQRNTIVAQNKFASRGTLLRSHEETNLLHARIFARS